MTAVPPAARQGGKTLSVWLQELVAARPEDRRMLSIRGLEHGLALVRVKCVRHDLILNWSSAYSHLEHSEKSHRIQHGPDARLHVVGDLRPLLPGEAGTRPPATWPTSRCKSKQCDVPIVWARTVTGSRMPVDAWPNPEGNVLLVDPGDDEATAAGSRGASPLAMVVRDEERATVQPEKLHHSHFTTCKFANQWRR